MVLSMPGVEFETKIYFENDRDGVLALNFISGQSDKRHKYTDSEFLQAVSKLDDLNDQEKNMLYSQLKKYDSVFSETPGLVTGFQHEIKSRHRHACLSYVLLVQSKAVIQDVVCVVSNRRLRHCVPSIVWLEQNRPTVDIFSACSNLFETGIACLCANPDLVKFITKMADLRLVSREFLADFIDLCRQNECLWKIKSKDYSDKQKKSAAYDILIGKLKEVEPEANKNMVLKKINSLRTCFRKELKKYNASLKSETGTEEVHKPNLWYFDLLLFLNDQETPRQGRDTMNENEDLDSEINCLVEMVSENRVAGGKLPPSENIRQFYSQYL
nr:unnamed protein product [Callosobruchus chinensis]